jgi:hypothetical protein
MDEQIGDAPEVFQGIFNTCILAGPSQCALASLYPTADAIKSTLNQYLDHTYKNWTDPGRSSYNYIVYRHIFYALYEPARWHDVASGFPLELATSLVKSKEKRNEGSYNLPIIHPYLLGPIWDHGTNKDLGKRQQFDNVYNGYLWETDYSLVMIQYVIRSFVYFSIPLYNGYSFCPTR